MLFTFFASLQEFGNGQNRCRNQSKEDAAKQNAREVLFDEGDVAEPITGPDQTEHPEEAARNGIELEAATSHVASTGYQRGKRANDRYEARQEHRLATVAFVECVSFLQGCLIDPTNRAVINLAT